MEVNNCDEKESVYNSKEKVSGDKKEVTLEQSVETIVHIIMDLAARKKREEAKSSSSNSAEKLEMEKEDSLDLNETGEVMEEEDYKVFGYVRLYVLQTAINDLFLLEKKKVNAA
ncbi:uncharacterized protein LOC111612862 isoform X2 [Centruroides sculpturatus]|uniref:uncharacterized protein LOC111612862 isoform X2 n=1 Tax=Centruroides sculpturatus TaxID=218467 RepID=UPI000C6DE84A|nr:uncharacterized protein LOC111612862 isoform X2 [Centruroides sculpturatus]